MPVSALPLSSRRLLGALMLAALPGSVAAQEANPRDTVTQRLEPQTIRGERGATVVAGASAMVVNVDSARTRVAPTLADLLRTVPLVLVRTNSRGEVELSVRGSESRQVGIMMNGMPLSPGWDGRADPSLVPLTGISRVSYVRSTASVLGGPNTLGGVIDLAFDPPPAGRVSPTLALGTDQTGARLLSASVANGSADGSVSWRVGGGLRQLDGLVRAADVPDPNGEPDLRTNTDMRQSDYTGSVAWRAENGAGLSALVSGYDAQRGVAPELHVAGPRYWRYPEQSRRMAQLKASAPRLTSGLGITEVEVSGGVLAGTMHIDIFGDATYGAPTGSEDGAEQVNSARGVITHTTPRGLQLRAAVTGNNVSYMETLNTNPSSHYRQDLLSSGLEANFVLGTQTLMSVGAVIDRGVVLDAGGRAPLAAKGLTGWRVGATRLLSGTTRVHLSASQRGRFPALRELYSGAVNRFEPNPDLKPEELLAAEAGVSFGDPTRPEGFTAQFTGFRHFLEDGIVRVPFQTTNRFIRVNRDETTTVGLEALLGWSGGAGRPSLTLDLVTQGVTIADRTAGGAERKPEHMPNFRAMLDGTMSVGRGVTLGANLQHVGAQYCVDPGSGDDVPLDGETIAGLTAHRSWSIGRGAFRWMRLLVGADNLTNVALYEQCGLPRAGRTVRLGIELR